MPARTAEKVYREILHASGKLDGKIHRWVVAVFSNETYLRSHAALLKMAYKNADAETIAAMDPHRPTNKDGAFPEDVKLSKTTTVYNPKAAGLDEDSALS